MTALRHNRYLIGLTCLVSVITSTVYGQRFPNPLPTPIPVNATSFNYIITASGTETLTTHPSQSFTYSVTASAVETWTTTNIGTVTETFSAYGVGIFANVDPSASGNASVHWTLYASPDDNGYSYLAVNGNVIGSDLSFPSFSGSSTVAMSSRHNYAFAVGGDPQVIGRTAIIIVTYPAVQYRISTATRTASISGSASVSAEQGSTFVATAKLPSPQSGGVLGPISFSTQVSNPNVSLNVSQNNLYAQTSFTLRQSQLWSGQQIGAASISALQGEMLITNSWITAPNMDTVWTATVDSTNVAPTMIASNLFAHYIMAPRIDQAPQSQSVVMGSNATMLVSAEGTVPLWYQWLFNGGPLAKATNQTLMVYDCQAQNAGAYSIIVSNLDGVATSSPPALLTVVAPTQDRPAPPTNFRVVGP